MGLITPSDQEDLDEHVKGGLLISLDLASVLVYDTSF